MIVLLLDSLLVCGIIIVKLNRLMKLKLLNKKAFDFVGAHFCLLTLIYVQIHYLQ